MTTYCFEVIKSMKLRAEATVNAEELLVHNSSQRQAAEGLDAGVVNSLGVCVPTFQLEGEVVCQVAAFVIAPEEPERVWVMDLERPQVEHAFDAEVASIYIVSKEEIASLRGVSADLE